MVYLNNNKIYSGFKTTWLLDISLKKVASIIVLYFISIGSAHLQDLSSLYNELESNNYELKAFDKQKDAVLEGAEQFVWLPDPEFGLGIFPSPVETRLGSQLFRLSAMQMIPNKGISNQKKQTALLKASPIQDQKNVKLLQNRLAIKKEWLNIYLIKNSQNIIKRNIELLESLENIALKKVESGKGKMSDVLIVQLKKNEIIEQVKILDSKLIPPNMNINQLLNRNPMQRINISENLEFPYIAFDKNEVLSNIQKSHPKVSFLNKQKDISRSEIQLSEYAQKPAFGVGLDYIYVNARNDAEPSWNGRDILQLKATMKIPINKKSYEAKDKSNLARIEALELQEINLRSDFERLIENAFSKYETAKLNKELAEKQIATIKAIINLLEKEYAAENSGFDQLISMELEIIKYEKQILESIVEAHRAINVIENLSL